MADAKVGPAGGLVGPAGGLVGPSGGGGTPHDEAEPGVASGTGTAHNPSIAITVSAGVAAGTGAALEANAFGDEGTDAVITLVAAEAIYLGDPDVLATRVTGEVLYMGDGEARVTRVGLEVLYLPAPRKGAQAWFID
jgi:hypothetical protein